MKDFKIKNITYNLNKEIVQLCINLTMTKLFFKDKAFLFRDSEMCKYLLMYPGGGVRHYE